MRVRMVAACLATGAASLVAACASSAPPSAARAHSAAPLSAPHRVSGTAAFDYLGPVSYPSSLDGGDINLAVPAAHVAATVSPTKAFAGCACTMSRTPTIRLALVTTTAAGTAACNGAIDPLIDNALTCVIEWTGVPCVFSGGPPRSRGAPPLTLTHRLCDAVDFVSAATGEFRYGIAGVP